MDISLKGFDRLDYVRMRWSGFERVAIGYDELEWVAIGWNGLEWAFMGRKAL